MKTFFLITATFCLCCTLLQAQDGTVFHNQGDVYCYGSDSSTVMYIQGHMKVSTGEEKTSAIRVEKSRVMLTGNFYNDVDKGTSGGQAFVSPAVGTEGFIEFCGDTAQSITSSGTTFATLPSKTDNYINFPNVEINNSRHVTLSSRLAAKTKNIDLKKGWLVLDSDVVSKNLEGVSVDENKESVLAHLLVDGNINYNKENWSSLPAEERGFIQVNLKVPGDTSTSEKSMVGFGIPFKEMYSDYFMFNTLLEPSATGFLGKAPITYPKTALKAGKGYAVGIDLRGDDEANYTPLYEGFEDIIKFSERATNGYKFNRHAFNSSNQVFGTDVNDAAFQNEELNISDVEVTLTPNAFNYLSNPFTAPLNIAKLLQGGVDRKESWNVIANVDDPSVTMPEILNKVWILNPDSKAEPTDDIKKSRYSFSYQVAMNTGGTYLDPDDREGVTAIAPLQMFVVLASPSATTMTIPKSERVMGSTRFLRSAPVENVRRDDFIIEFRDKETRTSDRASIVLRSEEEISTNVNYTNVERLKSTVVEGSDGTSTRSAAVSFAQGDFPQNLGSQIYTKDNEGKSLSVQFLPLETTKRVTLYHIPSSRPQAIEILGHRIHTMDKVESLWLEDRKLNKEVEVTPDMIYETYSEPGDSHERFALRFGAQSTGIEDGLTEDASEVYAYINGVNVMVEGFKDTDWGSKIELYNTQGNLLSTKTVNAASIKLYENALPGVYFVKVYTQKIQTIKLISR